MSSIQSVPIRFGIDIPPEIADVLAEQVQSFAHHSSTEMLLHPQVVQHGVQQEREHHRQKLLARQQLLQSSFTGQPPFNQQMVSHTQIRQQLRQLIQQWHQRVHPDSNLQTSQNIPFVTSTGNAYAPRLNLVG